MTTIQHPFLGLRKQRLFVPLLTFVTGFVLAAILLGTSSVAAQKDCPTATPTATPGGTLEFKGTGNFSTDAPIAFKPGVYSIKAELTADSDDALISVESIALDATGKVCHDQYLFQEDVSAGKSKTATYRYTVYSNVKTCDIMLNISASNKSEWKVTITPLKT